MRGFIWDPTTGSRTIDVPGATGGTYAFGINDAGSIVGQYNVGSASYGFLLDSGNNPTSFTFPGAAGTPIFGIDDRGDIVGAYDANGNSHGFFGQAVPEPGSLALMAAGLAGLVGMVLWSRRPVG